MVININKEEIANITLLKIRVAYKNRSGLLGTTAVNRSATLLVVHVVIYRLPNEVKRRLSYNCHLYT